MNNKLTLLLITALFQAHTVFGQNMNNESLRYKHAIGTSVWSLANLFPNSPEFYELDYTYRFTKMDAIRVKAITWKYPAPLGIPYGDAFEDPKENYLGYVRSFGIGMGYQCYFWKDMFIAVHATPFLQNFYSEKGQKIQSGFQLYTQAQMGYRFSILRKRFFIEPSITFNYWPINTNVPESFAKREDQWPNYFLFEPHLNIGVNF